jgi:hypothetical protein
LCLIFGTKNSKHQGTPGVFGSAVGSSEWFRTTVIKIAINENNGIINHCSLSLLWGRPMSYLICSFGRAPSVDKDRVLVSDLAPNIKQDIWRILKSLFDFGQGFSPLWLTESPPPDRCLYAMMSRGTASAQKMCPFHTFHPFFYGGSPFPTSPHQFLPFFTHIFFGHLITPWWCKERPPIFKGGLTHLTHLKHFFEHACARFWSRWPTTSLNSK